VRADRGEVGDRLRALLAPLATVGTGGPAYDVRVAADGRVTIQWQGSPIVAGGSPELAMATMAWHVNQQAVQRSGRHLLLHAAALARPHGRAVLVTGPSGAGKSTLAAVLSTRGWRYLTDEVVALAPDGVLPYPRSLALTGAARRRVEALGVPCVEASDDAVLVDAAALGAAPGCPVPVSVEAIVLLDPRRDGRPPTRVRPGEAVLGVASGCFNLLDHHRTGLGVLRRLALAVPAWRVATDGIDATADVVSALAQRRVA
jgi:hypothetical protein